MTGSGIRPSHDHVVVRDRESGEAVGIVSELFTSIRVAINGEVTYEYNDILAEICGEKRIIEFEDPEYFDAVCAKLSREYNLEVLA